MFFGEDFNELRDLYARVTPVHLTFLEFLPGAFVDVSNITAEEENWRYISDRTSPSLLGKVGISTLPLVSGDIVSLLQVF